jgi:hypothetical protein
MPIVFDTGASILLTPLRADFEGELTPPPITEMHGLKGAIKVIGMSKVSWTVFDSCGVVRAVRTTAYLVPEGNIRLFSPQVYFQENGSGSGKITGEGVELVMTDGTPMYFPLNQGNNLPLILTRHKLLVGISRLDAEFLQSFEQVSACLSVADKTNQNLTVSQRELLMWHHRLAHANFQWVQWLAATTKDRESKWLDPLLATKEQKVSSCVLPLCSACQVAKQA